LGNIPKSFAIQGSALAILYSHHVRGFQEVVVVDATAKQNVHGHIEGLSSKGQHQAPYQLPPVLSRRPFFTLANCTLAIGPENLVLSRAFHFRPFGSFRSRARGRLSGRGRRVLVGTVWISCSRSRGRRCAVLLACPKNEGHVHANSAEHDNSRLLVCVSSGRREKAAWLILKSKEGQFGRGVQVGEHNGGR
jgi:hypothetical protein